jgi:DNA-binding NtrC family response regulator
MRETLRRLVNRLWAAEPDGEEKITVLVITSASEDRESLETFARRLDWDIRAAGSCENALEQLPKARTAVILCDRNLTGVDWRDALAKLAAAASRCAIVLMSPVNDEYLWEEVIRLGGYDVLAKPLQEDQTTRVVNLAWSYAKEKLRTAS